MGCFAPDAPKPVNYGEVTRDTLQAQVDLAPQLYSSEAIYQPQYTALALQNLNMLLNGTAGGTQTVNYSNPVKQAGWYDAAGNLIGTDRNQYTTYQNATPGQGSNNTVQGMSGLLGWMQNGGVPPGNASGGGATTNIPQGVRWVGKGGTVSGTRDITTQASPGLFALMQQQASMQRAGDINDVANLGLAAHDALLASSPEQAALLARLNAQANAGLDAGSNLTPDEQRAAQQASRAAMAARGLGASNAGISDELLAQYNLGQNLLRQRQAFAQSVLGNNQAVLGDPWQQILNRSSGAVNAAQQTGAQSGPQIFNPESPLASSITAGNQGYAAMFADPSTISKIGGVSNLTGSFLGSIMGGMI